MGNDSISLVSTTDSAEDVQAALDATSTPLAEPAKPAAEPAKAAEPVVAAPVVEPTTAVAAEIEAPKPGETPEQQAAREARNTVTGLDKRRNKIQQQIDTEIARKHTAKAEADAEEARREDLRRENTELEAKKAAATPTPAPVTATTVPADRPEPKLDDVDAKGDPRYVNYEAWQSDQGKWVIEQTKIVTAAAVAEATKQTEATERARIERESATRAQQEVTVQFNTRLSDAKARHVDFDAVYQNAADAVKEVMSELGAHAFDAIDTHIVHSEHGPELLYYFGHHPEEVKRIANLSVARQFVELGKIEARQEAAQSGPSSPVAPQTKAPQPIKPVGSGPTASTVSTEHETHREYMARRDREEVAKFGRVHR